MGKRGTKPGQKEHSEVEKAAAVIMLGYNQNNYEEVAEHYKVSTNTIKAWQKQSLSKKELLPIQLQLTLEKLLDRMPARWTGNAWAIAVGILMDKWLLINGQATARTESIFGGLDKVPPEEKDAIIREAESIIARGIAAKQSSDRKGIAGSESDSQAT